MTTPESYAAIGAIGLVLTGCGLGLGLWLHRKLWRR